MRKTFCFVIEKEESLEKMYFPQVTYSVADFTVRSYRFYINIFYMLNVTILSQITVLSYIRKTDEAQSNSLLT